MLGGQSWQRVKTSDTNMSALVRTLAWGLVDQISFTVTLEKAGEQRPPEMHG